ncbi:hypothetical protein U9M48_001870 [Paspalum notatum var. saurae]|uniref:F-box/LRR-repeat protein 15/At3g58940/PEG3-like LRR domain-containing protein n=1 Tax=Paspalum notatum var. saurae TaxID=547442 RepID=A0AAQ3PPN4_PASNO
MSFLKNREAVRTCILSKRWRHLWRSMPCLDIDYEELISTKEAAAAAAGAASGDNSNPAGSDSDDDDNSSDFDDSSSDDDSDDDGSDDSRKRWERFEDFTVNLMLRCDMALLESFRLNIGKGRAALRQGQAWGWLRRAIKLSAPAPDPSSSKRSFSSWNLKRLHLCNVFLDNLFAEHVGSVCRSLQELELDGCRCKIQAITSHSLKRLVLKNCRWRELAEITSPTLKTLDIDGGSNTRTCLLVIWAPAVAYLHLDVKAADFGGSISIHEMPSLDKASIHIESHYRYGLYESKFDVNQLNLIRSLSNVTSLELSGLGTKVFGKKPALQEFNYLRSLLLGNCNIGDHKLGFFLNSSPNLENLTLRHCKDA